MAPLTVVERRGCDRFPIDVTTPEGAARAESFVWPDMLWRFRRMADAVDVAAGVPVDIDEQPAGEWLVEHLVPATGTMTVLMHSVMWQYVPPEEQASIEELLVERGKWATADASLAHLRFEPVFESDRSWRFELRLTTWPGGDERLLGRAHPHGEWVRWN